MNSTISGSLSASLSLLGFSPKFIKLAFDFLKYASLGGIAFLVDYCLFLFTLEIGLHYQIATVLGFIGGVTTHYLFCIFVVWRGTQAKSLRDIVVFVLIGVIGLVLTAGLMWVAVELLALSPKIAKLIIAAIVLAWNFGMRRIFVFFR